MHFKNHAIFTKAQNVKNICEPFFNRVGFNFMNYTILENNGSSYGLSTDGEYCEDFYNQHFQLSASMSPDGFNLWESYQTREVIKFTKEKYDYSHVITFRKTNEGAKEYFSLAAPSQNREILNFYQNHPDLLEKFIQYFKSKAKPLIVLAQSQKFYFPPNRISQQNSRMINIDGLDELISLKKYSIDGLNGPTQLTKKEMSIFKLYTSGISTKGIAEEFFRSQKTIEYHICSMKKKLGVSRKSDLIKLYKANFETA